VSQAHYQALNDVTWSTDGHLVVTCSTDGYCSLIHFARGELGAPYRGPIGADALNGPNAENAHRPGNKNPVFTTAEPSPANAGFSVAVPADEQPPAVKQHRALRQADLEVIEVSQAHYQALNDVTWSTDGHLVVTCSTDGYCSLIHFARGELGAPYRGPIGADALNGPNAENAHRPGNKNPVFTTAEPSPANAGFSVAVPADEQPPAVKQHRALRQADLEVIEVKTPASGSSVSASSDPVDALSVNTPAASCAQSEPVRKRRVPFTTLSVSSQPAVGGTTSCNQITTEQLTSIDSSGGETQSAAVKHSVDSVRKRRVPFVTLESHTTSASGATLQQTAESTSLLLSTCGSSDFSGEVSKTPRNDGCQKANDAMPSLS
ncbi:hypothetical protein P879_02734, partial [Paragonimus westermani]